MIRVLSIGIMDRLELALLADHKQPEAMTAIRNARRGRELLLFFYLRLVSGGIILRHDYSYLDGVRAAFTESPGRQTRMGYRAAHVAGDAYQAMMAIAMWAKGVRLWF